MSGSEAHKLVEALERKSEDETDYFKERAASYLGELKKYSTRIRKLRERFFLTLKV